MQPACVLQAELAEQAATLTQQLSQALATIGELEAAVESKNNEIAEVRREASDAAASTAAAEERAAASQRAQAAAVEQRLAEAQSSQSAAESKLVALEQSTAAANTQAAEAAAALYAPQHFASPSSTLKLKRFACRSSQLRAAESEVAAEAQRGSDLAA